MNWAAWEYQVSCKRRLEIWRLSWRSKPGGRVMIYDTRPASPYFKSGFVGFDFGRMADRFTKVYGGANTGRMGSGKNLTATQIMAQQQKSRNLIVAAQAGLNRMLAHQIDALAYGMMLHGVIEKRRGPWITFKFYERTLRWQSNLIDLDRSSSVTSLHEPDTSRSDGNKSKRGWLSKTRRRSTAWLPTPRTKLIQCQKPAANLLA